MENYSYKEPLLSNADTDSPNTPVYSNTNDYCNSKSLLLKNNTYINKAQNILNTGVGDNTGNVKDDVNRYRQILQNDWNKCCKKQFFKSSQCKYLNNKYIELGRQVQGGKKQTRKKQTRKKQTRKKQTRKKQTRKKQTRKKQRHSKK